MKYDIDEYKKILFDILLEFDRFCKKHNLRYTLFGGSLLGAIRHQGMVPWDDDIDVAMPRIDYDRFLQLSQEGISKKHRVVSPLSSDKWYYLGFSKVIDIETTLIESRDFKDSLLGVYMDIFPLDNVPEKGGIELFEAVKQRLEQVRSICHTPAFSDLFKRDVTGRRIIGVKSFFRNLFQHRFLNGHTKLIEADKLASTCVGESCKYVRVYSGYVDSHSHRLFPKEWFDRYEEITFEKHTFQCIKQKDKLMEAVFGDYMTPPPIEKRIPHHSKYFIDLHKRYSLNEIRKLGF